LTSPPFSVSTPAVYGVEEALKVLKEIDPALRREAIKRVKVAAEPMRSGIAAAIPSEAPLSGMDYKGRLGWGARGNAAVKVKFGGRKNRGKDVHPLLSVTLTGAGASIYDIAGRGSSGHTPSGQALVSGLTSAGGQPSRAVWKVAEEKIEAVHEAVRAALRDVSLQANVRMTER
jgi:hypothetical protein